jgi:predicted permease
VALSFSLHMHGYSDERADAFYRALLERVRAQATVRSASLATFIPLGGRVGVAQLSLPDRPADPDVQAPRVAINFVWPQFFETMDIRIVRGRALGDADMLGAASTAVVNETMARRFWPERNPIGQRFSTTGVGGPFVEVVGVARDTIVDEFTEDPMPAAYYPGRAREDVALLAWVEGDQATGLQMLEAQVRSLDASVAVFDPKTLAQLIGERLDTERALSRLLSVFGALALLLAAIGLYGVVAYTVVRRTREIGVRVALGARAGDVVRLFVTDAARLALAGLIVGIPPAIGVTVLLAGSIVGVRIADPLALGGVTALLAAVALLAAYLPARRATRVDPVVALRAQ